MSAHVMRQRLRKSRLIFDASLLGVALVSFAIGVSAQQQLMSPYALEHKPPDAPAALKPFIGEYGTEDQPYTVGEENGRLILRRPDGLRGFLQRRSEHEFFFPAKAVVIVHFSIGDSGLASNITLDGAAFPRRKLDQSEGQAFRIAPVHSVEELRAQALTSKPPQEPGNFRQPDLVELAAVDPSIHLDIRYATSNNFLGTPVYTQARAFLQRPAAEALVRSLHRLKPYGYALLIHDGYRPWYVTKLFWDATPPEGKIFVADPAEGSRHNRGCAVDLTLYEIATGTPVQMPGTYDEMSRRSFPDYPGGTSLQRWHRDLLRWAMESEGFTVYDHEWWHFDYKDWHEYPILNVPFEKLQSEVTIH
jgi:D-alanyl-D-alanine dipeptidase